MKRSDLKRIIKPLVKQCVKETLLEEGLLSSVISEVVTGLSPMLIENKKSADATINEQTLRQKRLLEQKRQELEEEKMLVIKEQKRKVLNASGFGDEIFKGLEPIPGESREASHSPLSGVDPADAGVDISGIMAIGSNKWDKLV